MGGWSPYPSRCFRPPHGPSIPFAASCPHLPLWCFWGTLTPSGLLACAIIFSAWPWEWPPVAGWIVATGSMAPAPMVLGLGVIFWTAGFDILYACQDVEFDRKMGLHSIPAHLGTQKALKMAALSHVAAYMLFLLAGALASLGMWFYLLSIITGILLIWEHRLITPEDLTHIDLAFFKVNSLVSASLFLAVIAGLCG